MDVFLAIFSDRRGMQEERGGKKTVGRSRLAPRMTWNQGDSAQECPKNIYREKIKGLVDEKHFILFIYLDMQDVIGTSGY